MSNLEVAYRLYEMADLMEFRGEDAFKVRAYRRGAEALEHLPEELLDVVRQGRLLTIEGIGKSIGEKIREILATGTCTLLEELRIAIPPGLRDVTRVPGIGPRTANMLYTRLGIKSLDELELAARQERLRDLPGFGPKKEAQVLSSLERVRQRQERAPLGAVLGLAAAVLDYVRRHPTVVQAALAGSVRRRKETVADLDIVCASDEPTAVMEHFIAIPLGGQVLQHGTTKSSVTTSLGRQVDLRVVAPHQFAAALHHFTGAKEHHEQLRARARRLGYSISEYGLAPIEEAGGQPQRVAVESEEALYHLLGLPYIAPELREGRGEIEAAEQGWLPALVKRADLKGDLHAHTRWSDGTAGALEMAEAARALGHEYLAITDHTQSLSIANGLTPERLGMQAAEIAKLNKGFTGNFRLLHGTEVDILKDGSLDLSDEVLRELDVVVASVHSFFRMDEDAMTERIVHAIKNPYVDIIGHPTGRLLTRRDPYPLNMERVLEAAAKTGTAMEINASPDRLDLSDLYARQAKELGVRIALNTDAHATGELELLEFGVGQARRGWLEPKDVVNAMTLDQLRPWLEKEKG